MSSRVEAGRTRETITDPRDVKREALEAFMSIWGRCAAGTEAATAAQELHKLVSDWRA